ncbi:hypothetical protein [Marinospirillum alkaliphilum]|uniref:Nucleotidyltransferase substrate binding protein, HI0074 family n=1 Tax=Marinospirillum alkaliphilum DSM 21637 TaxID=1122209 RepID=A0A1K1UA74_9GAMM|nr:hypothetical protein [Marinospirillum alkaliphilum]SFX09905.1 hypothetical protein SAMN02745752_00531 [Marinospirillum alkaliphilum DSM 21637]
MKPELAERLQFLQRVIEKEIQHLRYSASQVFQNAMTPETAASLQHNEILAEKVEAFASRFSRLQDTVGDKLLPAWLRALGEHTGAVIDNLDRAEKLGMLKSADQWLEIRLIRNQMVHEYIEQPEILANALNLAASFQPELEHFALALIKDLQSRGLLINPQ